MQSYNTTLLSCSRALIELCSSLLFLRVGLGFDFKLGIFSLIPDDLVSIHSLGYQKITLYDENYRTHNCTYVHTTTWQVLTLQIQHFGTDLEILLYRLYTCTG